MKKYTFLLFTFLFALDCTAATFEIAAKSYSDKNYELAYEQYMELVELGNKDAQFAIGVMYLYGQHVEKNIYDAHAWIKLSASKGNPAYVKTLENLDKKINTVEKRLSSEKAYLVVESKYGDEIVSKNLIPRVSKSATGDYSKYRMLRRGQPKYPRRALNQGLVGHVTIEYIVGDDGRVKYPRVDSQTSPLFTSEALRAAKSTIYRPAKIDNKSIDAYGAKNRFIFELEDGSHDYSRVYSYLVGLKDLAENGTSIDRYKYSMALNVYKPYVLQQRRHEFDSAYTWAYKAAIDGLPQAQYELGRKVLYGEQCHSDFDVSYFWLEKSANEGLAEAQLLLGLERIYGIRHDKNEQEGFAWLKKSAEKSDIAKLELAKAKVLVVDDKLQDIDGAKRLVGEVDIDKFQDLVTYYEVSALIFLKSGDSLSYKKSLKKLKKVAKKSNLPFDIIVSNINNRLKNLPIEPLLKG